MAILVTGGAGYIGSHTCVELLKKGYEVIIADNFSNSDEKTVLKIEEISGKKVKLYRCDLLDYNLLDYIFGSEKISGVIHFAGLKAVGESVKIPILYYENNLNGAINLFKIMDRHSVRNIVFSSSATVYGLSRKSPVKEDFNLSAENPYGRSKLILENILNDIYISNNNWSIAILRYFNPIGAHKSGLIGESPKGTPSNLLPYISQVAIGKLPYVQIFGNDYKTKDGTGVRDYIHVVDLAEGHIKAIEKLSIEKHGIFTYNLGTGKGYSVLEVIKTFEEVCGKEIKYKFCPRREGDIDECYADCSRAVKELGWEPKYGLKEMCEDIWRWQTLNSEK